MIIHDAARAPSGKVLPCLNIWSILSNVNGSEMFQLWKEWEKKFEKLKIKSSARTNNKR